MTKKIINVSGKKQRKKSPPRMTTWVIVVIIVLAVAAALTAVLFLQQKNSQPAEKQQQTTPASTIQDVQKAKEKPNETQLRDALAKNPSPAEKQQLLQLLADSAYAKGDYKEAVAYMRQAYEAGITVYGLVQGIGILYLDKLNDKPLALKYFKLARQLAEEQKNQDPYSGQDIKYLDEKIKELEAQGVQPAE